MIIFRTLFKLNIKVIGVKGMAIREKRFLCGKYLEVEIYPISKYEQKKSRAKKKMESRKEQKKSK